MGGFVGGGLGDAVKEVERSIPEDDFLTRKDNNCLQHKDRYYSLREL
jgi:hypothetical protein